jgi:hypothetical protein
MRIFTLLLCLLSCNLAVHAQILINEVLPSNVNGILDEDKEFHDWIEIYNAGDNPASLTGYSLTDDITIPGKWIFPAMSFPAKQHLLIFASGKNRKELPMDFETIIDIGDEWHFLVPDSDIGSAWHTLDFNDSLWSSGNSSFGYSDGDDTTLINSSANSIFIRKEFTVANLSQLGRLVLSIDYDDGFVAYINGQEVARSNLGNPGEIMSYDRLAAAGREALMYQGGSPEYYEISNPGSLLTEGTNVIAIQVHNNVIGSSDLSVIPFLSVGRFSGIIDVSPYLSFTGFGGLHTNFKLDADNEGLYLFNTAGVLADSLRIKDFPGDISYGRKPDGSSIWYYFGTPTPGAANLKNGSELIYADTVVFSSNGGKHTTGFGLSLGSLNPLDSIYYTTDGSIPDVSDTRYTGPIVINANKVIRARVIKYNVLPGPIGTRTFVTGRNHDLPIICLSTEPGNLWDEMSGIYAMGPNPPGDYPYFNANFWKDWERPVHFELYDVSGAKKVDQEVGMKIFGAWSRAADQKSIALFARKSYGKGSLKYQFFKDKPIDKFESLVLRNSGNDNMGLQFHDCFMTGLTREMDIDRQAYQPAAIYLNGEYWGLLNIREKVSIDYVAENHMVDADSVNLLEGPGNTVDGTNDDYIDVVNYMNIKTTLQNDADYNWVPDKIDLNNFIQYQLTQIYLNNRDWPGNNNKFWKTTSPGSKWRWIIYDTDFGFGIWNTADYQLNTLQFALEPNGPDWPNPPWSTLFLRRLTTNAGFRKNFIIQFCDRLNQDFHPDRITADLDSLEALYDNEIVYNFSRWWGSYDEWIWRINNRKTFGTNRPEYCRSFLQSQFLLSSQANVNIDVSDPAAGYVKLNTIYPKEFPFSGIYFKNIPITMTAIPKPGYRFVKWEGTMNSTSPVISYNMASAGNFNAVFTEAVKEDFSVIINEINFKSSVDKDTKDWIELLNNGSTTVDLSGWLLIDSGIDSGYVFPAGTQLTPGSYLVVCKDLGDFRNYNTNVDNSIGDLLFGLNSQGDIVRLFDRDNELIDAVNYGINDPWPDNANGTGYTLELKDPGMDNSLGVNWQAKAIGGTPGKINSSYTVPTGNNDYEQAVAFECFPNPFRDFTTVRFNVSTTGNYRLEIMDMQGKIIKVLADNFIGAGSYWIDWTGEGAAGGVYTIRLIGNHAIETIKVVYLR